VNTEERVVLGPREVRAADIQEKMGGHSLFASPSHRAGGIANLARLQGLQDEDMGGVIQG
jgi:hypothetical protein